MTFEILLKKYKEKVERVLDEFLSKEIPNLDINDPFIKYCYEVLKKYTLNGGKRLRPISLIMSYFACGGKDEKNILYAAIAIELHHTYSLILDDIMDEDETRRNEKTVYKVMKDYYEENFEIEINKSDFNNNKIKEFSSINKNSINSSNSLFSSDSSRFAVSFAMMIGNITNILSKKALMKTSFSDELKYKAMERIEKVDQQIYHGQMMDVYMENENLDFKNKSNSSKSLDINLDNKNLSSKNSNPESKYMEMIKLKTAVLFGLSFYLGSLFAKADENTQYLLEQFGINATISFQIQDDLIDITGKKGHDIGSDIKKGKQTILMIKAFERANDKEKWFINSVFGNLNAKESEIKQVIKIMHDLGIIKDIKKLVNEINNKSKSLVNKINIDLYYKNLFLEFINYMEKREK